VAQLAILVGIGDREERLHSVLHGLTHLGRCNLLVLVAIEHPADRVDQNLRQILRPLDRVKGIPRRGTFQGTRQRLGFTGRGKKSSGAQIPASRTQRDRS
jgi:hypothetical protein